MPTVRVLKNWRGFACGIYAEIKGQDLKDGVAEGALCPNAPPPPGYKAPESEEPKGKRAP